MTDVATSTTTPESEADAPETVTMPLAKAMPWSPCSSAASWISSARRVGLSVRE